MMVDEAHVVSLKELDLHSQCAEMRDLLERVRQRIGSGDPIAGEIDSVLTCQAGGRFLTRFRKYKRAALAIKAMWKNGIVEMNQVNTAELRTALADMEAQ